MIQKVFCSPFDGNFKFDLPILGNTLFDKGWQKMVKKAVLPILRVKSYKSMKKELQIIEKGLSRPY